MHTPIVHFATADEATLHFFEKAFKGFCLISTKNVNNYLTKTTYVFSHPHIS